MLHDAEYDEWWNSQSGFYSVNYGITNEMYNQFPQSNGFSKGDFLLVKEVKYDELNVGDIILHESDALNIPQRIVSKYQENSTNYVITKGDNRIQSSTPISEAQIIGKVSGIIPKIGWIKLWFIN